jgi:hypothetical protein
MKDEEIRIFISQAQFDALDDAKAKAILDHAEKLLKDSVDASSLIITRLTTLVTLVTAFMVGLLGYAVNRGSEPKYGFHDRFVVTAFLGVAYLYLPAILIAWNFISKKYYSAGARPEDYFNDRIFVENKTKELKAIYGFELMSIQIRIEKNYKKNKRRWLAFNIALVMILLCPAILYLIYLFIAPRVF